MMAGVHNLGSVTLACTPQARARGLLGGAEADGVLLLAPCRDIHTFGMRRAIDVAFIDGDGRIVASCRNVGPGKRIRCRRAVAVIERVAREGEPWPEEGDQGCAFFHVPCA